MIWWHRPLACAERHTGQRPVPPEKTAVPMFWRLLLTYLLLVVTAVGLVGLLVWQKDPGLFGELADTVGVTVVLILALSAVMAYLFARGFATPLGELAEGAKRLAAGDLGH